MSNLKVKRNMYLVASEPSKRSIYVHLYVSIYACIYLQRCMSQWIMVRGMQRRNVNDNDDSLRVLSTHELLLLLSMNSFFVPFNKKNQLLYTL